MFQPHITTALKNAIKSDRIPTTLIFTGWTGTGKTSLARIYAMALNCTNLSDDCEPCNECENCKRIMQSTSMDVEEINASEKTGIDDVRRIIEDKCNLAPSQGRFRVFILDEIHSMSSSAQNAFLKTLEEPPEHVKFILCTTELDRILDTIQCRAHTWIFDRVPDEVLVANLKEICEAEGFKYEEEALKLIAMISDGSPRKSINLMDQLCSDVISIESVEKILKISPKGLSVSILEAAAKGDTAYLIDIVDVLNSQGKNLLVILKQISNDISNMIKLLANIEINIDNVSKEKLSNIIKLLPSKTRRKQIRSACRVIIELFEQINYRNVPKDLVLTNGFIDLSIALKATED